MRIAAQRCYHSIFVIIHTLLIFSCAPSRYTNDRVVMAAPLHFTIYAPFSLVQPDWENIFAFAEETGFLFNHRLTGSPVSLLNKTGSLQVPDRLFDVITTALRVAQMSAGAFDPTVLPLMDLWGFETGGRLPDKAEIAAVLDHLGYGNVRLAGDNTVYLEKGVKLDVSGIGEGAVVDALAEYFDARGYTNYLIDASGEIIVRGLKPAEAPWVIAIRSPRKAGMPRTAPDYSAELLGALGTIEIGEPGKKLAVTTSGDYEKFFVANGTAYAHILDPRTGRPATGAVSVTVVTTRTCAEADALGIAAFVLGFEAGFRFLEDLRDVEGLIIREKDGRLEMKATSGFPELKGK